jgi:hypothetical protein
MSKGGSTKTTENSTQAVQLPAWMSEAGQNLFNKTMADSAAHPVTGYTGQMTAPTSANQNQASGQAAQTSGAGQGQVALGTGVALSGTGQGGRVGTSNFDAAAADRYMSPYLRDVQDRTVQEMQRQGQIQMQGNGDAAAAAHAFGGTRQAVQDAETAKGINNNILDYLARSNQAGYENAQGQFNTDTDRQLGAATTNAGIDQQELDRRVAAGAALGNLGQQASGINSEGIMNLLRTGGVDQDAQNSADQAAYNEFLRMQDGAVSRDQDIMSILAGTPRNVTTTSNGTQKTSQSGGWLNTALGAAQLGASFFSDERLKENVEDVGTLPDGLPVVDFNYRKSLGLPNGRFRGVLAQDVARVRPQSLGPKVNGFATVDASLAPQPVGN